jgi:hypothetical protein
LGRRAEPLGGHAFWKRSKKGKLTFLWKIVLQSSQKVFSLQSGHHLVAGSSQAAHVGMNETAPSPPLPSTATLETSGSSSAADVAQCASQYLKILRLKW